MSGDGSVQNSWFQWHIWQLRKMELAEAKLNADRHLQSSGVPYTIVRPGKLTFEKGTGKIELAEKLSNPEKRDISREDVARTMIAALDIENARGQTVELLAGDTDIHEAWKAL